MKCNREEFKLHSEDIRDIDITSISDRNAEPKPPNLGTW